MLRQKLISSVQAGPFSSTTNRIIYIDIPEGVVSMADSFVVLTTQILNEPTAIMNLCVSIDGSPHVTPFNVDFFRNASLSGSKCGQLENLRRVNVFSHNVMELSKYQAEKESQVVSLYQTRNNRNSQLLSPYVDFKKTGDIASTYRLVKLRIPLSQLFPGLGSQVLDTSLTGTLRVHLELENGFSFFLTPTPVFQGGVANEGVLENVVSGSTFNVLAAYPDADASPYIVGMNYTLTYTDQAEPANTVSNVVTLTSASFNALNQLSLTFAGTGLPLADQGGGKEYVDISVAEILAPDTVPKLQVLLAECNVAEVVGAKPEKINELTYLTWTTQEENAGSQQFFSKAFQIEPTCVNVLTMLVGAQGTPLSNNINVSSYRLRVNQEDVTDRDVVVQKLINNPTYSACYFDDTLHYSLLYKTFGNASIPLRNYTMIAMSRDGQENAIHKADDDAGGGKYGVPTNRLMIMGCPTPMTPTTKELQVNINCQQGGIVDNVILFKQIVKTVQLSA